MDRSYTHLKIKYDEELVDLSTKVTEEVEEVKRKINDAKEPTV
jgi:hypothetical protein